MKTNKIKCRFCNYETFNWRKSKKGKISSGYEYLLEHVLEEHPNEYDKMFEADKYFKERYEDGSKNN